MCEQSLKKPHLHCRACRLILADQNIVIVERYNTTEPGILVYLCFSHTLLLIGSVRDKTQSLMHAKQTLQHRAISPASGYLHARFIDIIRQEMCLEIYLSLYFIWYEYNRCSISEMIIDFLSENSCLLKFYSFTNQFS